MAYRIRGEVVEKVKVEKLKPKMKLKDYRNLKVFLIKFFMGQDTTV